MPQKLPGTKWTLIKFQDGRKRIEFKEEADAKAIGLYLINKVNHPWQVQQLLQVCLESLIAGVLVLVVKMASKHREHNNSNLSPRTNLFKNPMYQLEIQNFYRINVLETKWESYRQRESS